MTKKKKQPKPYRKGEILYYLNDIKWRPEIFKAKFVRYGGDFEDGLVYLQIYENGMEEDQLLSKKAYAVSDESIFRDHTAARREKRYLCFWRAKQLLEEVSFTFDDE